MKTIVLAIEPISDSDSLKIWLSIGSEQHSATFSRELDDFGEHQLQIITYNKEFYKYNPPKYSTKEDTIPIALFIGFLIIFCVWLFRGNSK